MLLLAIGYNQPEQMRVLLAHGADVSLQVKVQVSRSS